MVGDLKISIGKIISIKFFSNEAMKNKNQSLLELKNEDLKVYHPKLIIVIKKKQ